MLENIKTEKKRRFWHHDRDGSHVRAWFHMLTGSIKIEFNYWTHFCHLSLECDDEGWTVSIALPPLAIWFTLSGFGIWRPQKKCVATWDNDREFWLTDRREFEVGIYDWTLRLTPWGRWGEWHSKDPWWIRGVHLDIKDFVLGRMNATKEAVETFDIEIPMPEGTYTGHVTIENWTRKRKRWFGKKDTSAWVDIPGGGIPFPGKGENSWDCGMDGLCGYGSSDIKPEAIIAKGVESVLNSRRRYGGSVSWVPSKTNA